MCLVTYYGHNIYYNVEIKKGIPCLDTYNMYYNATNL